MTVRSSHVLGADGLLSSRQTAGGGTSYFYAFDPSGNPAQRLTEDGSAVSSAFDGFGAREGAGASAPTLSRTSPY